MIIIDDANAMPIGGYIIAGLFYFVIIVLAYNGVSGLAGRRIWIPNRGGGGRWASGAGARVAGFVLLVMALLLLYLPFHRAGPR